MKIEMCLHLFVCPFYVFLIVCEMVIGLSQNPKTEIPQTILQFVFAF